MGNAYNSSALWRERLQRRKEKMQEKIDESRLGFKERNILRATSDSELESLMDNFYNSVKYVDEFMPSMDRNEILCDIKQIQDYISQAILNEDNRVRFDRLEGIEKMLYSMRSAISSLSDREKMISYLKKSVPSLYVSYLTKVEGKFGKELYDRL